MAKIKYRDTDGDKTRLLPKGYFGLDDYPAGGDEGRVYVGTGTENIALAKKTEVIAADGKADAHIARVDNPHNVTKAQVGLANVDNTSDINKPISTATQNALNTKVSKTGVEALHSTDALRISGKTLSLYKGDGTFESVVTQDTVYTHPNSGVTAGTYPKVTVNAQGHVTAGASLSATDIPSLDASKITSGIIDAARLPSFVDDVLEYANLAGFPTTGEAGKIYIALDTNKAYRWSGSTYVYITSGAVDSVAGKTGVVTLSKGDVGLGNADNTSDANKPISTATQTALNTKVDTSTNQTIAGVKTFSSNPISTATQSTAVNALTRKDYVDGLNSENLKQSANLSDLENASTARTNLGLGTASTRNVGTGSGDVMEVGTGTRRIPTTSGDTGLRYARIGQVTNDTSIAFLLSGGGDHGSAQRQNIIITAGSRSGGISVTHTELTGTAHTSHVRVYYVPLGGSVFDIWINKASYQRTISLHILDSGGQIVDTPVWETTPPEGAVLVTLNTYLHTGNILTTTGQSTHFPMTQKAVTDAINGISDERDKTEINEIGLGLEVIENLKTFSFKLNKRDWYRQEAAKELIEVKEDVKVTIQEKINDDVLNASLAEFEENDGSLKRDDVYTGFIAQDLKETLESLDLGHLGIVKNYAEEYEGGEDRFYIEHLALLPFLVNSVKQLSARVKALESRQGEEDE